MISLINDFLVGEIIPFSGKYFGKKYLVTKKLFLEKIAKKRIFNLNICHKISQLVEGHGCNYSHPMWKPTFM